MDLQYEVSDQPARPTAAVRTRTGVQDLPRTLGNAYGAVMQYLGGLGVQPTSAPFVIYYNMDMQDLDIEAGFCVPQPVPASGEVLSSQVPAGKEASCLFTGPYQECGPVYDALNQWIAEQGLQPTGVVSEWYLNDPAVTLPAELQTRIVFQVK